MTLRLSGVGYRYAGARRPAIVDVDLDLGPGEVVGLAGASEAGKTTLCLVAAGLAPRVAGGTLRGRVLLDGEDIVDWPMHRVAARVGIGFSSPASQLSQVSATVFEEVAFGPMNHGVPRAEIVDRCWAALEALRVEELAARDPLQLSGGQQQLVAMAGLLAAQPGHLVLDEPTAQLDPEGTRLVAEAIEGLARGGASILVAEQKTDLLAAVADRVVVLSDGSLALTGSVSEVLADPRLEQLGVAPPAAVRLRRMAGAAGVDEGRLTRALADA